jgi:hypothetical protein
MMCHGQIVGRRLAMSETQIRVLDTVALLRDLPELGLKKGQVGAVVEELDATTVIVEFANSDGVTFALPNLQRRDLLRLAYEQQAAE